MVGRRQTVVGLNVSEKHKIQLLKWDTEINDFSDHLRAMEKLKENVNTELADYHLSFGCMLHMIISTCIQQNSISMSINEYCSAFQQQSYNCVFDLETILL